MKKTICILLLMIAAHFSIANAARIVAVRDTVLTVPEKPTTGDSITIELFNDYFDCFTTFHDTKVSLQDSLIYLQFSSERIVCNECAGCDHVPSLNFKIAPLAAGTYAILELDYPYCALQPCAMADRIAPLRVGTMTVTKATTGAAFHEGSSKPAPPMKIAMDKGTITMTTSENGSIAIRTYSLRGELLAQPFRRFLSAGEYRIEIDDIVGRTQGKKALIMEISIDGIKTFSRTMLFSRNR